MESKPGKAIQSKTGVRSLHKASRDAYAERPAVTFWMQDWDDGYNVGGLFRLAEALGVKSLYSSGKTPQPDSSPLVGVTSMGAHRRVGLEHFPSHADAARAALAGGWTLVAVEIAEGAVDVADFEFPDRCCLVLGAEGGGVYGSVLAHCQSAVHIPMFGKGRSLNVVVAASVVAYQAVLKSKSAP